MFFLPILVYNLHRKQNMIGYFVYIGQVSASQNLDSKQRMLSSWNKEVTKENSLLPIFHIILLFKSYLSD